MGIRIWKYSIYTVYIYIYLDMFYSNDSKYLKILVTYSNLIATVLSHVVSEYSSLNQITKKCFR